MSRPKRQRKICGAPQMQGFKPFGIPVGNVGSVKLSFDEYESIKLLDYDLLTQEEASEKMEVSRPTLTRIYENARRTIAKAFIEGMAIVIEGGDVEFDKDWYRCTRCFKLIAGLENHLKCQNCPKFGTGELVKLNIVK